MLRSHVKVTFTHASLDIRYSIAHNTSFQPQPYLDTPTHTIPPYALLSLPSSISTHVHITVLHSTLPHSDHTHSYLYSTSTHHTHPTKHYYNQPIPFPPYPLAPLPLPTSISQHYTLPYPHRRAIVPLGPLVLYLDDTWDLDIILLLNDFVDVEVVLHKDDFEDICDECVDLDILLRLNIL